MTTNTWQKGGIFPILHERADDGGVKQLSATESTVNYSWGTSEYLQKAREYENEIFMSTTRTSSLLFIGLGCGTKKTTFLYLFGGGFEIVISIDCMN